MTERSSSKAILALKTGSSKILARAIEEVYRNGEEAKTKASAAKRFVLSDYSVENMAKRYLEEYLGVLARKR